jgi:hypothetical protein
MTIEVATALLTLLSVAIFLAQALDAYRERATYIPAL